MSSRATPDRERSPMRLAVIGTGHVGLVTCLSLAARGHDVVGVDADADKIDRLVAGDVPFYEPGTAEALRRASKEGRLRFTVDTAEAVRGAEVAFICVGTPAKASGEANLTAIENAGREVARAADGPLVIAEKSTVPAGTAERLERVLAGERGGRDPIEVVCTPEFLREGRALHDALRPDRILVGARSTAALQVMRRVYAPFVEDGARLIETDFATAELAKHACNAFLALKISYINAVARLCERAGADVDLVAEVMGSDARIGSAFLGAGLGYGGYCFPKDVSAFERVAERLGYAFPLLSEVTRINDETVVAAVEKIRDAVWILEGKTVALLGLAFKPETDDVRFSPSLALARALLDEGCRVVAYDPFVGSAAEDEVPGLEVAATAYLAAQGAHCLVIGTRWEEFRELDLAKLGEVMASRVVVDGRNLLDPASVTGAGLSYYSMGRRPILVEPAAARA